ncbi:MAG: xanthine dehydrogenase, partial [Faecalibacterium sp.]
GTVGGSVGGGSMEHRTILAAQEMLAGNTPAQQLMHFSADGKDEDAACGGSMEIWLAILQAGEELK